MRAAAPHRRVHRRHHLRIDVGGEAAIARVRAIHDRVTGVAPDGRAYRANDPHLLAWVHATEVDSFLRTYRRYGPDDLDAADEDGYVAGMAGIAERLGVIEPPGSRDEPRGRCSSASGRSAPVPRPARRSASCCGHRCPPTFGRPTGS
ncbi:MAG: oxygenase MpaB family protein [Acidimicrobiales bacterium]